MKQYSYKDIKLLRQTYKANLDLLYQSATQQRIDKLSSLVILMVTTTDIPYLAQQLNSSGDIQLTASLEILKVKCGMYKQFSIQKLSEAIDMLLYMLSKYLKNYSRKVKEIKIQINSIQFYGKEFVNQEYFLIYVTFFKLILSKYLSEIKNQSKIQNQWSILISNMINTLKRTEQQRTVYKTVNILYQICIQNTIFKKQVVKNGILQYLIDFVERCQTRWLTTQCIKLIALLTEEKPIAKLLIQQKSQDVFTGVLNKYKNEDLKTKITEIMNNVVKFGENQTLSNVAKQVKTNITQLQNSTSQNQNLDKSMNNLKLYSLSNNFTKVLSNASAHKWLVPLLSNPKVSQKVQLSTLDVFQSILKNKQQYKAADEAFSSFNKTLIDNLKAPKSFQHLNAYLKVLGTGLKKDYINKQYIKKNNIVDVVQKIGKRQEPTIQKLSNQIITLMQIKQGKIKSIPLEVNRKSKDTKQLQKLNSYLDNIINLNLYDQIKKEQLEVLAQFLDVHQNDYSSENQQQVQENIKQSKNKILDIIKALFTSKPNIVKLSTQKLLNGLINGLVGSPALKQSLQMTKLILRNCNNLTYNKDKCLDIIQKIQKNNPFDEKIINSCGQILYHMNSIPLSKELLTSFKKDYKNNVYLQKLTTCLSTIPDRITEEDIKLVSDLLQTLNNQKIKQLPDQLLQNILLVLIRIAKISNKYKKLIRNQKKLLQVFEEKLIKPNLKVYILELFSNIIQVNLNPLNQINKKQVVNSQNISPIQQFLKNVLLKVIDINNYSYPQLKLIERMSVYQEKIVVDKVKLKNNQLIYLSGQLFALILEKNLIQSKKLSVVIDQLQKETSVNNKNLEEILIFFSHLQLPENFLQLRAIVPIIKVFSGYQLSKYEIYPDNYNILNLGLKVLQKSIDSCSESDTNLLSTLVSILNDLFKIFYVDKKQQQAYTNDIILGSSDKKQQTIENIYNCFHEISKKIQFKFKETDMLVKYAENGNNAYIMYKMAAIVQNSNFQELNNIKLKLKSSLIKYPKVKKAIDFDKINLERGFIKTNNVLTVKASENFDKQESQNISNTNQVQNLPNQSNNEQIKISEPNQINKKQKIGDETIILQLNNLLTTKKSTIPIQKLLDAITQKNPVVYDLLIKLYNKYENKQLEGTSQLKLKIINKISQQNVEATSSLFQMFQKHIQSLKLLEKIKVTGERALEFAVRIFKKHPEYASRIIQYNLFTEKDFQYIEDNKIPQSTYEIYSEKYKEVDASRYLALMIGTTAKSKSIQMKFHKLGIYKKIIEAIKYHKNQVKVIANSFYALAGLTFCLEEVTKLITLEQNITLFVEILKIHENQSSVVESGSCLISNLCYHNQQSKKIFFSCGVIEVIIHLFKINLEKKQYKGSTFKQMLRVLGNCSLLVDNAKKIISLEFIPLSINLIDLVNYNEDLEVLKYIVQVYSNLSSHTDQQYKLYLSIMYKQGTIDILLTLLQSQILNTDIIAASIDAIDGLCQDKEVQKYAVSKRLISLLIDILKSHEWNQKIVVKGIRVVSNLTLDKQFIVKILQANFASIIANILANRKLEKSKLTLYTMKIITRIFNAKMKIELIIKSSYIDCVLESLKKQTELFIQHLQIINYYSKETSQYLNKKTFTILIPLLERFIFNEPISQKIIMILKNIDRDVQVQSSLPYLIKIYLSAINNQKDITANIKIKVQDLLSLLIGYCSKSHNLRSILRERNFIQSLVTWKKVAVQQQVQFNQAISVSLFVILNNYISKPVTGITQAESEQFLKRGIQCKMYRRDSSYKKAMIVMNAEYQLRGFKFPDGEIKDKYRLNILNIKDYMFGYQIGTKIWDLSVFGGSGGIFEKSAQPKNCCTIIGPVTKIGAIIFNLQFSSETQKEFFQKNLVNLVKCLKEK